MDRLEERMSSLEARMVELGAEMKDIRRLYRLWTKDLTRSYEDLEDRMEAIELRNQPAA